MIVSRGGDERGVKPRPPADDQRGNQAGIAARKQGARTVLAALAWPLESPRVSCKPISQPSSQPVKLGKKQSKQKHPLEMPAKPVYSLVHMVVQGVGRGSSSRRESKATELPRPKSESGGVLEGVRCLV